MNLVAWGQTDTGRVRDHNEDSFVVDPDLKFYMVADGVGGSRAGEVASSMATEIVHQRMKALGQQIFSVATSQDMTRLQPQLVETISSAINEASEAIFTRSQREGMAERGMATTSVCLQIAGSTGVVGHVGDSRAYLVRDGQIYQVTEDHTLLQALLQTGAISAQDAETFPHRHVIARSVGKSPAVKVDTMVLDVHPGDRFVLCSDGLTDPVKSEEIQQVVTRMSPEQGAQRLIDMANQRGGKDNVTVVIIEAKGAAGSGRMLRTEQKVNFLRGIFLFQDLSFQEVLRVLTVVREVRVKDGAVILREGDFGDEFYILVEGKAAVYQNGVFLTEIEQGGHFGELALLGDGRRSATVTAVGNTVLLTIGKRDFYHLVSSDHGLALRLLWGFLTNLTGRLKSLSSEVTNYRRSGR